MTGVKFSHDGETLATTSYDGLCRLWSVATGACLKTLTLSVGVGGRGVSGDGDGDGGGDEKKRGGKNQSRVVPGTFARWTPNDKHLLVGTLDSKIRLWDVRRGKPVRTYASETHVGRKYCSVAAIGVVVAGRGGEPSSSSSTSSSPAACYVIAGSEDGGVSVFDLQSSTPVARIEPRFAPRVDTHTTTKKRARGEGTEDEVTGGEGTENVDPMDAKDETVDEDALREDPEEINPRGHVDAVICVDFAGRVGGGGGDDDAGGTYALATAALEKDKTAKLWLWR